MQVLDDGTYRMEYRYIPWTLQFPQEKQVNAALNEAARKGLAIAELTKLELPQDLPEEELNDLGDILWQSLPHYATLTAKDPWLTWKCWLPPGPDASPELGLEQRPNSWQIRSNRWDEFIHEILSSFPTNRWAMLHFREFGPHLPPYPDGTPSAMGMAEPLKGEAPEGDRPSGLGSGEGWEKGLDLPRADPSERIEYPQGLFKRVWLGLANDQLDWAREWETREPDVAKLVEGAVSVVPPGGDEFAWHEHHLLRLDIAARLLPRIFALLRKHRMGHQAGWALKLIRPCYHGLGPQITFADVPVEAGFRAAIVLPKPIFNYDPDVISNMERDIASQWR